jgi:hypothetical protein
MNEQFYFWSHIVRNMNAAINTNILSVYEYSEEGEAILVTCYMAHKAHKVVRRRGSHIF